MAAPQKPTIDSKLMLSFMLDFIKHDAAADFGAFMAANNPAFAVESAQLLDEMIAKVGAPPSAPAEAPEKEQ